jgi:hypothetical protein
MQPARYHSEYATFFYVYYKMEKGQWVVVAVHPEGERRPHPFTPRTIIEAVDELGAFQKVNTWLQKSNAALAEQDVSLYTTGGSTGATLTGQ